MSTTASSIRNIKSRLPTSNSISNMTTNGNEPKSNRIYLKKPLSATNISQNSPPKNVLNNNLKKRALLSNNSHQNKLTKSVLIDEKRNNNNDQQNGHYSNKQSSNSMTDSPSSPIIFHAIAPAPSSEEFNDLTKEIHEKQKVSL